MKIYLAHPITANKDPHVEEWKAMLKAELIDVEWLDPTRYGLDNDLDWQEIVKRNVADILNSDLVLAYLDNWSWGVISECNIAHMLHIPVIGYRRNVEWKPSPYERNAVRFLANRIYDVVRYVLKLKDKR